MNRGEVDKVVKVLYNTFLTESKQMSKTYIVQIQGWGDREDEFYNMGAYSTRAKAEAALEDLLVQWEADGCDREDVVYEIEPMTIDA
jgi:hypothetical protein